jgi:hypothetical protein
MLQSIQLCSMNNKVIHSILPNCPKGIHLGLLSSYSALYHYLLLVYISLNVAICSDQMNGSKSSIVYPNLGSINIKLVPYYYLS